MRRATTIQLHENGLGRSREDEDASAPCHQTEIISGCFHTPTRVWQTNSKLLWKINTVWRTGWDSNPRYPCRYAAFRVRCHRPLDHPSAGGDKGAAGLRQVPDKIGKSGQKRPRKYALQGAVGLPAPGYSAPASRRIAISAARSGATISAEANMAASNP